MATGSRPRDEGSIPRWPQDLEHPEPGELDPQQYKAALKAHEFFVAMANLDEKPSERSELFSFLPRLDAHRRNHTVLIDGTRGSGKTAVMLRLLQDWSDKLTGESKAEVPLDAIKLEPGARLVPVGLLDLEAVPTTANLATRLGGMFERIVSAMERRGVDRPLAPSPWASLDGDELSSRAAWRRYVKAAALEWDRSLERRRANIDPEAYAVEVEQAEREGLSARACFREFIDKLAGDWKGWRAQENRPFFIVPIDDADLNPDRVAEMFGLMRTLWHPRVGYLLTGDSELFEHVLARHFRAQIDMPELGGVVPGGRGVVQVMPDPQRTADRLAQDYYHKAVSLDKCLKLEPIPSEVRLAFIKDALSGARLRDPVLACFNPDDISCLALPGRWRKLKDLRDFVVSADDLTPERFAFQVWKDAIDDARPEESVRTSLRDVVRFNGRLTLSRLREPLVVPVARSRRGYRASLGLGSVQAHLEHEYRGLVGNATDLQKAQNQYLVHGSIDEPLAVVTGSLAPSPREVTTLDQSVVAAYLLARTVAGEGGLAPFLVQSHYATSSPPRNLYLSWGAPYADTIPDNRRLIREWNASASAALDEAPPGLHDAAQASKAVARLTKSYLSVVLSVRFGCTGQLQEWSDLAAAVVDRYDPAPRTLDAWWFVRAVLLAAPEWGLPQEHANAWLRAVKELAVTAGKWDVLRNELRTRRQSLIQEVMGHRSRDEDALECIGEIDRLGRQAGFEWNTLTETPIREQPQRDAPVIGAST